MAGLRAAMGAALVLFAVSHPAAAGQVSDPTTIHLKIVERCDVVVPTLDFGPLVQVTGTEVATSTVSVNCSTGTLFLLSFSPTGITSTVNTTLLAQTAGNLDTIPVRVRRTGSFGVGRGFGPSNAVTFPIRANFPTASAPKPDDYVRTINIYVNY